MKVLFLAHRLPYAPNRGDRIRAYHILREMSKWAEVDLCALVHDDEEASHVRDLNSVVRSVTVARVPRLRNFVRAGLGLSSSVPLTHILLDTPGLAAALDRLVGAQRPDVVYCFCTGVGPLALRPSLADVPLVLDMVDVDSMKWAALARSSNPPLSWVYSREARCLSRFESTIARRAFATTFVTQAERDDFEQLVPSAHATVVGNGIDREYFRRKEPSGSLDGPLVVFCGVMNYPPNVQGIQWFATHVWPTVRARLPGATLKIVGARPNANVRKLGHSPSGIEVTGTVPDVRPFLWAASVAIAPLITARGVQTKVLESIASGLTTVVTPPVARGIPSELRAYVRVAATPQEFADAVVDAVRSGQAEALSELPLDLSWEAQLAPLRQLLASAASKVS